MGNFNNRNRRKNNSTLAIAAGCAVVFMFIATIISIILYRKNMGEISQLLADREYEQYDYYVVFISSDDNVDYWKQVYNSAKNYGKENGICVDMLSESLNVDYEKTELLEMAIDSGCDGILIEGDDSDRTNALIKKAVGKGISVVTMDVDAGSEYRQSFVGVSNYSMANLYVSELAEVLDMEATEDASVLILESAGLDENRVASVVNGIQEATTEMLKGQRNISFTRSTIEDANAFSTEEYVHELFQSDELPDVIICLDELSTTCVYQTLIDYNKVGKVKLLGYYKSDVILQGIKQGVIDSTVTVDTISLGQVAVNAFSEYRQTGYVSDYLTVDINLINKSNVSEFAKEVADE